MSVGSGRLGGMRKRLSAAESAAECHSIFWNVHDPVCDLFVLYVKQYCARATYRTLTQHPLMAVYRATSANEAEQLLEAFATEWGARYPSIAKSWRSNWARVIPMFGLPDDIRRAELPRSGPKSGRACQLLGAACPYQFGHCPHPSNRWAEGFTDRPVAAHSNQNADRAQAMAAKSQYQPSPIGLSAASTRARVAACPANFDCGSNTTTA